jgi:hypothetical protein
LRWNDPAQTINYTRDANHRITRKDYRGVRF